MRFTVVYAMTRDLELGQHECYHHVATVTAHHPEAAQERCRRDALPGFEYHVIAVIEGDPPVWAIGPRVNRHWLVVSDAG